MIPRRSDIRPGSAECRVIGQTAMDADGLKNAARALWRSKGVLVVFPDQARGLTANAVEGIGNDLYGPTQAKKGDCIE